MNAHKHKIKKLHYLCSSALQLKQPELFVSHPPISLDSWIDMVEQYRKDILKVIDTLKTPDNKKNQSTILADIPKLNFYFKYELHQMPIIQWDFSPLIELLEFDIKQLLPAALEQIESFQPEPPVSTKFTFKAKINRQKNSGRFYQVSKLGSQISTAKEEIFNPYIETIAEHILREFWDSAPTDFLDKFGNKPHDIQVTLKPKPEIRKIPQNNEDEDKPKDAKKENYQVTFQYWCDKSRPTFENIAKGICIRIVLPCYFHETHNLVINCFLKLDEQHYISSSLSGWMGWITVNFKAFFTRHNKNANTLRKSSAQIKQLIFLIEQFETLLTSKFIDKLINEITPFANQYYPNKYYNLLNKLLNDANLGPRDIEKIFLVLKFCNNDLRALSEIDRKTGRNRAYKQTEIWTKLLSFDIRQYKFDEVASALRSTLSARTLIDRTEHIEILKRIKVIAKQSFPNNVKTLLLLRNIANNLEHDLKHPVFKLCDEVIIYQGSKVFTGIVDNALFTLYTNYLTHNATIQANKIGKKLSTDKIEKIQEFEKTENNQSINDIIEFLYVQLENTKDLANRYDKIQPICHQLNQLIAQPNEFNKIDKLYYQKLARPLLDKLNALPNALSHNVDKLKSIIKQIDHFAKCIDTQKHLSIFLGQQDYILNHLRQYDKSLISILMKWLSNPINKIELTQQLIIDLATNLFTDNIKGYKVTTQQIKDFSSRIHSLDWEDNRLGYAIRIRAIRALHNELQAHDYQDYLLWTNGCSVLRAMIVEITQPEKQAELDKIFELLNDSYSLTPWLLYIEGKWIKWIENCLTVDCDDLNTCQQTFGDLLLEGTQEAKDTGDRTMLDEWKKMLIDRQESCL